MSPTRIETREDLEEILAKQTETIVNLGTLVKAMDQRIKLLTALLDHHHELMVSHGWATPRPETERIVH